MSTLKKVWDFLNGKKTAIGGVLVFVASFEHLPGWIGQQPVDLIYYIGSGLLGTGLLHKWVKK